MRDGRANRDRRDVAFCRSVIAEAQKRHVEPLELPEPVVCVYCGGSMPVDRTNAPYCSAIRAIDAEDN